MSKINVSRTQIITGLKNTQDAAFDPILTYAVFKEDSRATN